MQTDAGSARGGGLASVLPDRGGRADLTGECRARMAREWVRNRVSTVYPFNTSLAPILLLSSVFKPQFPIYLLLSVAYKIGNG